MKLPTAVIFFTRQFYMSGFAVVALMALGFAWLPLFWMAAVLAVVWLSLLIADVWLLFRPQMTFRAERRTPRVMGLGDHTPLTLHIHYGGDLPLPTTVIDELPEALQHRDFALLTTLVPGANVLTYHIVPTSRGVYGWGNVVLVCTGPLRMAARRVVVSLSANVPVYPSVQQMHQVALLAFSRTNVNPGLKNLKRIGQSYEFEQIKPFVEGDDLRNINWKATGRTRELKVNQFQDERSQNVYCVISKGRSMKTAFHHMSMLDYAINSTLAMSNVALKKYDRVGLITFSDKIGTALRADNRHGQLQKILEALYAEKERDLEPSYELLYRSLDRIAPSRSLVLLFTHFETPQMAERVLPILSRIARRHLLVTILFKDPSLYEMAQGTGRTVDGIYSATLAGQHIAEREEIAQRLRRNGIQAVLSTPEALSVSAVNKYLELKSRGLI